MNREKKYDKIAILTEIFEPVSMDCRTPKEDLQLAITLNPDLDKILMAIDKCLSEGFNAGYDAGASAAANDILG